LGLFGRAGRRRRGREAALDRAAGLDRIIQGQDIGAYGRQHEADNQPGAPIFVEPGPIDLAVRACFACMGRFVAVCSHHIFP